MSRKQFCFFTYSGSQLGMSGNVWRHSVPSQVRGVQLELSVSGKMLNTTMHRSAPLTKNCTVQNVKSAEVEKPWPTGLTLLFCLPLSAHLHHTLITAPRSTLSSKGLHAPRSMVFPRWLSEEPAIEYVTARDRGAGALSFQQEGPPLLPPHYPCSTGLRLPIMKSWAVRAGRGLSGPLVQLPWHVKGASS